MKTDNGTLRGVGQKRCFGLWGIYGINKFTFSHCSMLTVNVIIKRYLSGKNCLKAMILSFFNNI